MKTLTGKSINDYAITNKNLPRYFGDKFWPAMDNSDKPKKVNGEFIAKKYKAIIELVQQCNANVLVESNYILITYPNGQARICRDVLTDTFLLPYLLNDAA